MSIHELTVANKEVFISMTNKFLDTIYDSNEPEHMESAPLYEELRKSLTSEAELTEKQLHLILLLTAHMVAQFASLAKSYNKASYEMEAIHDELYEMMK